MVSGGVMGHRTDSTYNDGEWGVERRADDIMKKSGWHYKETAVKIHIFAA